MNVAAALAVERDKHEDQPGSLWQVEQVASYKDTKDALASYKDSKWHPTRTLVSRHP